MVSISFHDTLFDISYIDNYHRIILSLLDTLLLVEYDYAYYVKKKRHNVPLSGNHNYVSRR